MEHIWNKRNNEMQTMMGELEGRGFMDMNSAFFASVFLI